MINGNALWQWIVDNVLGKMWYWLEPLFKQGVQDVMLQLLPLALETVLAVANDPSLATNTQKREAALQILWGKVEKAGINASEHLLMDAIQLAVGKMKELTPPVAPPMPRVNIPAP